MNDEVEQVKERLDITEVVGSYLTLKRAGANLKGSCPFHNEKTPSFMVNPERQIFKCFGCGEGGDIFTFIEKIEGVDFYNALKLLADRAGVKLSSRAVKRGESEYKADLKTTLYEINDLAAKLYHKLLVSHPKADNARRYLEARGITTQTIDRFCLGYAPNSWDFLIRFMKSKSFKEADVFKSGLLVQKNQGEYYDRFRGRIMFPINNVMGSCVGFTSRVIVDDGKQAKYVNSAESPIYRKGKILYALDSAKMSIREQNLAVIVEGQMDVIACHQAGFTNVVASSGTAFTAEQMQMLNRYAPELAFAFDSDVAGETAMKKTISMAIEQDINVKIIEIPSGFKDPDEAIKKDPKIWAAAVKGARSGVEIWIDKLVLSQGITEVNQKKLIAKTILPLIKQVKSELEKEHYIKYLAKKLAVSESSLLKDLVSAKADKPKKDEINLVKPDQLTAHQRILAIAWSDKSLNEYAKNNARPENFDDALVAKLWDKLIKGILSAGELKAEEISILDQWSYQNTMDYDDAAPDVLREELVFQFKRLNQEKNESIKEKYAVLIRQAQAAGDSKELKRLLSEFSRLIKE